MSDTFDDYTIYLSEEAQESLAAYICSACGGEMAPAEDGSDTLVCSVCGKVKTVSFCDLGPGDELCGGVIRRVLGGGSCGELFMVEYPDYSRSVVKVLKNSDLEDDASRIRRFEMEADIMAKLPHPNIVQLKEFVRKENALYLVMEYVEGYNLLQMVSQEFYFSPETVLEIAYCLADALRYAWENCALLHRDIKPSNIMISSDGEVKILDFGLSKDCGTDTGLTAVGQALGSPGFMSPEQFRDSRIKDCRSDIFSLGVTMYFVLSGGKMPYSGKSALAAFQSIISTSPEPIRKYNSEVPEEISGLVMSMISADIEKRPENWSMLMSMMEDIAKTL